MFFRKRYYENKIYRGPAIRLNSSFCQILNDDNMPGFLEKFVNIVSYTRDGIEYFDFVDNNISFYESRIERRHVYGVEELNPKCFIEFIVESIKNNYFVNIWCDEFYIQESSRYRTQHFVHPITIYGIEGNKALVEFFHIAKGLMFVGIPLLNLKKSFYAVKKYYCFGAYYDILDRTISTYKVKDGTHNTFCLSSFLSELSDYICSSNKINNYEYNANNIVYGIGYYNKILSIIQDDAKYSRLPYKCIYDLNLHKEFFIDRLRYIKDKFCCSEDLEIYINECQKIQTIYKQINILNLKYNVLDKAELTSLSNNPNFKADFISLIKKAQALEYEVFPKIYLYLTDINKLITKEGIKELTPISFQMDEQVFEFPKQIVNSITVLSKQSNDRNTIVPITFSNGDKYYINTSDRVNVLSFEPVELSKIILKTNNSDYFLILHPVSFDDRNNNSLQLLNWTPRNHIQNWNVKSESVSFNIAGKDPYITNNKVLFDANKNKYLYITYSHNNITGQAQLFFLTKSSGVYSYDKSLVFKTSTINEKHMYKIDMNDISTWTGQIQTLRFDPVDNARCLKSKKDHTSAIIYDITISDKPPLYSNCDDYSNTQGVNQWSYLYSNRLGIRKLKYSKKRGEWKRFSKVLIGSDYQISAGKNKCSRCWECPSNGNYIVEVSAEKYGNGYFSILLENKINISISEHNISYKDTIFLAKDSILVFSNVNSQIKKLNICIHKI